MRTRAYAVGSERRGTDWTFPPTPELRKAEEQAELEAFLEQQRTRLQATSGDPKAGFTGVGDEEEDDDEDVDHSFAHLRIGGSAKGKPRPVGLPATAAEEEKEERRRMQDEARHRQAVRGKLSFSRNPLPSCQLTDPDLRRGSPRCRPQRPIRRHCTSTTGCTTAAGPGNCSFSSESGGRATSVFLPDRAEIRSIPYITTAEEGSPAGRQGTRLPRHAPVTIHPRFLRCRSGVTRSCSQPATRGLALIS